MKRVAARCLAASIAVFVLLIGASSALAFGVTSVTVTPRAIADGEPGFGVGGLVPADPFASGAHPALDIGIEFDNSAGGGVPAGDLTTVETLTQHLGPGIVANPQATGTCSQADFNNASAAVPGISSAPPLCDPSTQVGTNAITLLVDTGQQDPDGKEIFAPQDFPGKVFNLQPRPGEAARLGITAELSPPDPSQGNPGFDIKLVSPITIDPKDLGLNTKITMTSLAQVFPLKRIKLSLWGYAAPGLPAPAPPLVPFFTSPTACTPATVSVTATAFQTTSDPTLGLLQIPEETSANSGSYTPTDCAHEPFDSAISLTASPASSDTPSAVAVDVKPAPVFAPRVTSYVARASVTLPPGMFLNPVRADGTDVCTDEQFNRRDRSQPAECPASSAIGDATIVSPALGQFSGKVYLSTGTADDVIRLFVDVPVDGVDIKLVGDVRPDPVTGQVTTVFDKLPPTAFTDFKLAFTGGSHASLITPTACGTGTITADLSPFAEGVADSISSSPFTTSFDGNGAACPGFFRPSLSASLSNPSAGQTTSYSLTFKRPDRDKQFAGATFKLPAGLVGNLALPGLTKCSTEVAAGGACQSSSRIGSSQVLVGAGDAKVTLTGDVFLTEPLVPGDPAGLSVRVPAKIGSIDLGRTIIPVRLQLRPDGGLTATTQLPQFQDGVPTEIGSTTIAIDRPGFMVTPTSCGAQPYFATFTAVGGGSAPAGFTGSIGGCEKLPFAPKLGVTLGARGATGTGRQPSISTVLTQRRGEADLRRVHVVLPAAMSTNLKALNAACTQAAYDAGRCGARARAGSASAVSPLVAGALSGSAYFVQTGPGKLPKLVIALRGPLSLDVTGTLSVARNGQLATTIAAPDLPVSRFALTLHGGRGGVLINNRGLCTKRLVTLVQSVGQNGKKTSQRAATAVTGCSKAKPKKKAKRRKRH